MDRATILLSTQRALIGSITKNMRAITIGFSQESFTLRVYFLTEPSTHEKDLLPEITTQICADIPAFKNFFEEYLVTDKQVNHLEMLDVWVYMEHH